LVIIITILTNLDIAHIIAQSADNTFSTLNPDAMFGSSKPFDKPWIPPLHQDGAIFKNYNTNQSIM